MSLEGGEREREGLLSVFEVGPLALVEGTHIAVFEPSADAVEMERVLRRRSKRETKERCGGQTLQTPQAMVHSLQVAESWLPWHSMQRSWMWLRQMAHVSTWMSHDHSATAFHFLISKWLCPCSAIRCCFVRFSDRKKGLCEKGRIRVTETEFTCPL